MGNILSAPESAAYSVSNLGFVEFHLLSYCVLHWQVPTFVGAPRSENDLAVVFKPGKEMVTLSGSETELRDNRIEVPCSDCH